MQNLFDYVGFEKLYTISPIMHAHDRIIPQSPVLQSSRPRSWSRDCLRPKFCGLGLGLEALTSAVFETGQ